MNPNIAQNDKKIDFTQFYQNQNQLLNKEYNQVSVFEKEGEQQGNIQNIVQNGNSNLVKLSELSSGGQNILNKISLTDFQKLQPQQIPKQQQQTQANQFMFPIAEIEEENVHGNRSQGLIKFESIDNISLFIDNEESEEQKRSTDVGYNKQTQENEFIENHQRAVKDDQILDQSEFSEEIRDKIVDLKDIIKQIESSDNEEEDGDDDEGVDDDEINQGDERDNEDDLMDSQEEQDLNEKIQNTHLPLKRKNSVNQIKLIKEEEKKIRRAFRDLTTSNNKLEMLRTQKQMQIAEKVGVKLNYGKQLSSSRLKKQAQHKVMKKILNKKIQILVQTVMGQAPHSSLASKYSQRNSHRLVPQVSQQSDEKPEDLFNSHQFENLMNSSPNDLTPVSQKSSHIQKTQNFLFFKEEPLFRVSQTSESNKKVEIGLCESIYQSSTPKGKQLQSSQRSIMTPRNNQHSEKPKKVGFAMKSKFAKNENDDCDSVNQDEDKFQKPRFCDSQMNSDEGDDSKNEAPNILIREMGQEKEKETTDDENASQLSEDNIDQQMNQIYNSRVPNFQLMLYIEKMVSQYKKNYGQSEDIFKTDDYQCYEEIEHNEQQQDYNHLKEQAALDNSMEIPIDIIKPNFDVTELQDLPSYLSNQLQIIENKMQQIIEFTYDESKVCIDRIKKLYQVKQKKLLFARSKIDSVVSQSIEPHRSDSKQNRDLTPKKNANFLNIEINPQMKSPANGLFKNQLNQIQPKLPSKQNDSPQNANLMKEISPGKVNLGYNIKFSFGEENQETGKDDYNFFTELEKKNKIIMQKNQSQFDDASPKICKNSSGKTPKGGASNKNRYEESLPQGMEAVEEQPQNFSNALQVSSQGKTQKSNLKIQSFNKFGTATMSEQDKIKNEFKKMFSNMRGLHGDSAISLNISDMTNNS